MSVPSSPIVKAVLRVPVFVKIMGIALGLTIVFAGLTSWQLLGAWRAMADEEIETSARLAANDVADHVARHLLTRDLVELRHVLRDAQARTPDLAYVIVVDAKGQFVAGSLDQPPSAELLAANAPGPDLAPRPVRLDTERGPILDVAVPVLGGRAGTVRVGHSETAARRKAAGLMKRVAAVTAVISLLGIGVAWSLTRLITRPIRDLVRGARDVREGRYGRPVEVGSADELGSLAAAFNEMTTALADKERVRRELRRRAIEAAEDERKRVSRDIHDDAGQRLVSLLAGLGAAEAEARDEASRARLAELREIASQTLAGLHEVSVGLRPSVLDDVGLCAALRRQASAFEKRSGVAVRCVGMDAELSPRLAPESEVALYRIVQEALTNAYRHGRAESVTITLARTDGKVVASIEDDGAGFDGAAWREAPGREDRLGLLGIEERAALLGGTLEVASRPGSGTRLRVEIPLSTESDDVEDPDPDR